jgi:hypothetical protein
MPTPENALLKSLSDEIAQRLTGAAGADAVLLMERLQLLSTPDKAPRVARPGTIGIWEAGPQGGYERSAARRHEWDLWADVPSIPPKGERRRIALVGESVARGYLYGPEFTPAQALEASSTAALGEPVEVIDLAKTNLNDQQLTELIAGVPILEPDALVVFAGNNWGAMDKRYRHLAATALRERGALGLKEMREERLIAFVDTLREQLTRLSASLPVVLVIPEINLGDWRLDSVADAPWLAPGHNRRWLECRAAGRSAFAAGRLDEAAALGREMVELDESTAASGWTLLADCARARGDQRMARSCLERASDAHRLEYTYQTPRTLTAVQRDLRASALPGRISVVDLPDCFAAWLGGTIPDRRLFLDYCHLTAEGIRIAMAATALEIAALLTAGRSHPELTRLVEASPPPSERVEAAAHFAAAIHAAHWGQTGPFVSYLCHEATRRSSEIAQAMRLYLEVQARRAPSWACAATERLAELVPAFLRDYIILQPKLFDPVLLPAIAEALEDNGIPSAAFLDELRQEERSLSGRPSDLLDPYYRASWADLDWLESPTHFRFRRAYAPISRYPWVSRASREVTFELTCRRGDASGPAEFQVLVNGAPVAHLSFGPEWSTQRFHAPADLVRLGANWLEIHWPLDLSKGAEAIEHIARELEHDRVVPLQPVFAELSSLRAVQP